MEQWGDKVEDINKIHDFAVKWIDKFRNQQINYIELTDACMSDDCKEIGFEMDYGHAFESVYGKAISDSEALDNIIDDVTDVSLLGSAIYSRCNYFKQLEYNDKQILELNNRVWFILALSRLALLTGENPFIFDGIPKKVRIISNSIGFGLCPNSDDLVEQRVTINFDGHIWYSAYAYGDGFGKYKKIQSKNYKIASDLSEKVLNTIACYFSNEYDEIIATDIGNWEMEITNTDGKTYKFRGSLCANFEVDGVDLSNLIRDTLNMQDLYVFDGNNKTDVINRIVLDYHRQTKFKPNKVPKDTALDVVTWDYTEQLIIDRKSESLVHIRNIGSGCKVSCKYEIEGGIESLLDSINSDSLFENVVGNPNDVVETPNEFKKYKITIDYKKNPQKIIIGTFDKKGLPDDFDEFADFIFEFMGFYGQGEILNPSVYGKIKRCTSDYIFCSVEFEECGKSYYYIADEDEYEIGDFVLVPTGKDGHEVLVEIVNIEYFSKEDVPLPIEQTKHIIRKISEN